MKLSRVDSRSFYLDHLLSTLSYARERDYTGWDLYDGESSRILRALPADNKWLNLAFQQSVRRAPVNIRRLLMVEQRRNYMGAALFTMANLAAYELTREKGYREEARRLADWLVEERCRGYAGYCGSFSHPLQDLSNRCLPKTPDIVDTAIGVRALLAAGDAIDPKYRELALTAPEFVFEDLDYRPTPDGVGARIHYRTTDTGEPYTLNANALGARLLLDCYERTGEERLREAATEILKYVASKQTPEGGWKYMDPASASHLSMDNFHNGYIVESFHRYEELVGDGRFDSTLDRALCFYRNTLFDDDGAPHFDESNAYPRDVHSSAVGAIVFSRLGETGFSRRVLSWAIRNLSDGNGRFYHEQRRFYTKRITLMRWCQAWMAHALGECLIDVSRPEDGDDDSAADRACRSTEVRRERPTGVNGGR